MNVGREKILLEVVKDIVEATYPRYNDKFIKQNIIKYLTLQQNKKEFGLSNNEEIELIELNNYFFGNSEGIISSDSASSVVDMFKATYNEVEEILKQNNLFGPELISLLSGILNIHTKEGQDKNKLTADYLNQVIIPAIIGKKINVSYTKETEIKKSKSIDAEFSKVEKTDNEPTKTTQKSILANSDISESDKNTKNAKLEENIKRRKAKQEIQDKIEEDRIKERENDRKKAKEKREAKEAEKEAEEKAKKVEKEAQEKTKKAEAEKAKKEAEKKTKSNTKGNTKDTKGNTKNTTQSNDEESDEESDTTPINFKTTFDIEKKITNKENPGNYDKYLFKEINLQGLINFLDNYNDKTMRLVMLNLHYLIKYNFYDDILNTKHTSNIPTEKIKQKAEEYSHYYNLYDEILSILKIYNDELNYYNFFIFNDIINELEKNIDEIKKIKDKKKINGSDSDSNKISLNEKIEKIIKKNKYICEFINNIFELRLFNTNKITGELKQKYKYIILTNIYKIVDIYNNLDTLKIKDDESIQNKYLNKFVQYIKDALISFNHLNLELTDSVKKDDFAILPIIITQKEKITSIKNDDIIKQLVNKDTIQRGGTINQINFISLVYIYKLYYNCISFKDGNLIFTSILNINEKYIIYLFYLFFNTYAYYFKDDINKYQIIEQLKNIITDNTYNQEILKIIASLINSIFTNIYEIFNEYISEFYETDSIIQNYFTDKKQILYYLFINFIYPFYINIPEDDLKISLNINGTNIKIIKKHNEILYEINEMFYDINFMTYIYNYLLKILTVKLLNINDYLKSEISYLFSFIYKFTSHKYKITLNSLYEINAYLIICLLSSSDPIELKINDNIYKFPSSLTSIIKSHPYVFEYDKKITVEITTSKIQEDLYNCILNEENVKQILLILTEDFSYLNLNLTKLCKYKLNLNKEIIDIINNNEINDNLLIDYQAYNFSLETHYKPNLQIFNVLINGKYYKLLFSINYAIYLCASLYKKVSLYNYSTLIYLFIYIKHQIEHKTREYLEILNYDGYNDILNKYKKLFSENGNNLIFFLKIVIISMQDKLSTSYDLNSFLHYLLNFNQNKYINKLKSKIHININFITEMFKFDQSKIDITFYTSLFNLSIILYEVCILSNIDKKRDIIQFMYNFFIPILKELYKYRQHIAIEKLEKYVIDIRAIELSNMICKKKLMGGGVDGVNNESDNGDKKNEDNETSKKKNDIDKIIEKIDFLTKFKKDFEELKSITDLKKELKTKLIDLFEIPSIKSDKQVGYITLKDYKDILPSIASEDFLSKIANLSSAIDTNKKAIQKELVKYGYQINNKNSSNDNSSNIDKYKTNKIKEDLKLLKDFIELLESNKLNPVINKIIIELDVKNFIKDVNDYIQDYEFIYDNYIDFLQDGDDKYNSLKESIKKLEEAYKDKNAPRKNGGYKEYIKFDGGKGDIKDLDNEKIKKIFEEDTINDEKKIKATNKIDNLIKNVKKIKSNNVISKDIQYSSTSNENVVNSNINHINYDTNLFEKMLNTYNSDLALSVPEIATNKFYDDVLDNNLDPEIELALTFSDKIIFIVIISLITLSSLYVIYYCIDINLINGIIDALYYYVFTYLIIFTILLFIINVDLFKLRILINYFNMHINSSNIYTHYILQIMISYIIYLLIINLNSDPDPTRLSKNQKFKLKNKLNILTIIVLIFISMFVLIL